jgi:hypothetical protein
MITVHHVEGMTCAPASSAGEDEDDVALEADR